MILQALNEYYRRLSEDPDSGVAPLGMGPQKIAFCVVLDASGRAVDLRDLREPAPKGKKLLDKRLMVPKEKKRSGSGFAPQFLWDNTGYVLGWDPGKGERAHKSFDAFRDYHLETLEQTEDEGLRALAQFLKSWQPPQGDAPLPVPFNQVPTEEIAGSNLVFMLDADSSGYLHQRPAVRKLWGALSEKEAAEGKGGRGTCLVTGQEAPIPNIHPAIKGVWGAQSSGAALVSFNLDAFTSYGKKQNFNAPVSLEASFAYTTALNHLLRPESSQNARLGNMTLVFWAERPTVVEGVLGQLMAYQQTPEQTTDLELFFEALAQGKKPLGVDADNRFYVLGLSPNASRLAVRMWQVSSVEDLVRRLSKHFEDLSLERSSERDPPFPSFSQLLLETAVQHKFDNIPPLLEGALMRAVLTGGPYPESLLGILLGRIRADRRVNYLRAAMVKALLIRNHHLEVSMSLDPNNIDPGYRLGRLFAVLEQVQKDAINPKATIKDRFFGAASATPGNVFPLLVRNAQVNLPKARRGITYDKLIEEVSQELQGFPAHLTLKEQGQFVLGYYHQRQQLFAKKAETETEQPVEQTH